MKRLIIFLLSVFVFHQLYAQNDDSAKYTHYKFQYGSRMDRYVADKMLYFPYRDSLEKGFRPGAFIKYIGDNQVYQWENGKWNLFGGGLDATKVPLTRTITINGVTQDLSVNRTWTITKADIGLGNVDNTSDITKPVSISQQAALDDTAVSIRAAILTKLDSTLGIVYHAVGFSSLADFVNRGATASIINNDISFSGGANNFNQTLEYNRNTLLEQWHQSAVFIPTEKTATSYGFGLGIRSTNSAAVNVTVKFDATTGSNAGKLLIYAGSNTLVKTGETAIAFNANDSLELHMERAKDSIYTWVLNRTQKITSPKLSYGYSFTAGTTVFTPNTGRFAIHSFGGAFKVAGFSITSNTPKRPDIVVIGDSKTAGYFSNSPYDRWAVLLRKIFPNTVIQAGSADMITDAMTRLDETLSIRAKQIILCIGVNDIRAGVDSNTIKSNYSSYVASLQAGGAKVYHLLSLKEGSLNADWFNNFMVRTWPTEYIDSRLQYCNDCLAADNIHLNNKGNKAVADAVINIGKLHGQTSIEDNSLNSVLAKGSVSNITPVIGSIPRLGGAATGSFSEPKLYLTSSAYPSIVMESGTSNFGGGSILWKTNRGGPKVNPALVGDSVGFAIVGHVYDNTTRQLAFLTADNTNNLISALVIRQAANDFNGTRSRVTVQAGQNLYAGFELPGTANFNTSAVFAVNNSSNPFKMFNLPAATIDTTNWKPFYNNPTNGDSYRGSHTSFALGTTGTDLGWSLSGLNWTLNVPSASATARGVITTGAQTIAGAKNFTSDLASTGLTLSGLAGTGTRLSTSSSSGVVGAITNGPDGQVMTMVSGSPAWANAPTSGTYTPTVSGLTNVISNTPHNATWMRVGNTVTVAGAIDIGTAATGTVFSLFLSLPIASNFTGYDGGGTGGYALGTNCYTLTTNVANDVMQLQGTSENTGMTITYHFTYTIK
jgi:lysophospholipase L1-like esterase